MTAVRLIVIGASTGGTDAIRHVLEKLPRDLPPIAMTQHMPEGFTRSFAERLDRLCGIAVHEVASGDRLQPGHAYLAPGHSHFLVKMSGGGFHAVLSSDPPVNRHRPSVEVLFQSAAKIGRGVLGVMLTGMGRDGAQAMRTMRDAGAYNLVQDEATSVVFGMPREAIAAGAAHEVLPLHQIGDRLVQLCHRGLPDHQTVPRTE